MNHFADSWDDETKVFENGAKSSQLDTRFDLIPARALARIAHVLHLGCQKYGEDNWRGLPVADNVNHCTRHALALNEMLRRTRNTENLCPTHEELEHASHAATRALFVLEQLLELASQTEEF